jgi:hypothetical protein
MVKVLRGYSCTLFAAMGRATKIIKIMVIGN